MQWISESYISDFFSNKDFDIRKSHNGRWIDQKCTPDVVCIVSDCILNYVGDKLDSEFSSVDIWHSDYTKQNVQGIFGKPELDGETARNEYDKYFQQPMEMLSEANVLNKQKKGTRNFYSIGERSILEFISIRERNALSFIQIYVAKVLTDSGIMTSFESFFSEQTQDAYDCLKSNYEDFIINYTPINGKTECRRIFTKVINPLSFQRKKLGTERGRISKYPITYDDLMYNRDNFRDLYADKPKGMTRRQYAELVGFNPCTLYTQYASNKAKHYLKLFNDTYRHGITELSRGPGQDGNAIHMHHIFPESSFPEISGYYENLIALTPTQHLTYAHPQGNTHKIDKTYQHLCLVAKTDSIETNLTQKDEIPVIYEFAKFQYVLSLGLSANDFKDVDDMDFQGIRAKIECHYSH